MMSASEAKGTANPTSARVYAEATQKTVVAELKSAPMVKLQ